MATLLSWTSVGIGDLDVFVPSPPCLVVYTSYDEKDRPESSVTYFWQDETTGLLNHQLLYTQAAPFETALAWAQEHAPTRSIERIHVKHARPKKAVEAKRAAKPARKAAAMKAPAKKAPAKKAAAKRTGRPAKRAAAKRQEN